MTTPARRAPPPRLAPATKPFQAPAAVTVELASPDSYRYGYDSPSSAFAPDPKRGHASIDSGFASLHHKSPQAKLASNNPFRVAASPPGTLERTSTNTSTATYSTSTSGSGSGSGGSASSARTSFFVGSPTSTAPSSSSPAAGRDSVFSTTVASPGVRPAPRKSTSTPALKDAVKVETVPEGFVPPLPAVPTPYAHAPRAQMQMHIDIPTPPPGAWSSLPPGRREEEEEEEEDDDEGAEGSSPYQYPQLLSPGADALARQTARVLLQADAPAGQTQTQTQTAQTKTRSRTRSEGPAHRRPEPQPLTVLDPPSPPPLPKGAPKSREGWKSMHVYRPPADACSFTRVIKDGDKTTTLYYLDFERTGSKEWASKLRLATPPGLSGASTTWGPEDEEEATVATAAQSGLGRAVEMETKQGRMRLDRDGVIRRASHAFGGKGKGEEGELRWRVEGYGNLKCEDAATGEAVAHYRAVVAVTKYGTLSISPTHAHMQDLLVASAMARADQTGVGGPSSGFKPHKKVAKVAVDLAWWLKGLSASAEGAAHTGETFIPADPTTF